MRFNKLMILVFAVFLLVNVSALTWRHNGTNTMSLTDLGNLNVLGNVTSPYFFGGGSGLTGISGSQISNDLNWLNTTSAGAIYVPYTGATANLDLGNNNFSVGTSDLFVNSVNGYVGIGTANPGVKLSVDGSFLEGTNTKTYFLSQNNYLQIYEADTKGNINSEASRISLLGNVGAGNQPASIHLYYGPAGTSAIDSTSNFKIIKRNNNIETTVLFLGSTGNVGIGTTSPAAKLDISAFTSDYVTFINNTRTNSGSGLKVGINAGSIALRLERNSGNSGYLEINFPSQLTTFNSRSDFIFQTTGNEKLRILNNGNVGIGTTSPNQKLTLGSGSNFATDMTTPTGVTATLGATGTLSGTYYYKVSAYDGVGWTDVSSEVSGTVDGGTTNGTITVAWTAVTGATGYRIWRGNVSNAETGYYYTTTNSLVDDGSITFTTGTPPTSTTAYVNKISSSGNSWFKGGNVGIGTASPAAKLDVAGSGDPIIKLTSSDSTAHFNIESDTNAWGIEAYGTGSAYNQEFGIQDGNDVRMIIDTSGNIGIGTPSPTQTLDVNGNIIASNFKFNDTNQSILIGTSTGGTLQYVTAVGYYAGNGNTGIQNSFFGRYSGSSNTGPYVTATGYISAYQNTGSSVTASGYASAYQNTGPYVTASGYNSAYQNTGSSVTASGYNSAYKNTGTDSSGFGYQTLYNNSGNNIVALGYQAGKDNTVANQFIVQQANVNAVPLIQGDFATGNVGIGTTTPTSKLQVAGTFNATSGGGTLQVDSSGNVKIGL